MNWVSFPALGIGKIYLNTYLFKIFGLEINFYALILGLAVSVSIIFACFLSKKFGVLESDMLNVIFISFIFGIIGARFYYVIFNLSEFFKGGSFIENLIDIFNLRSGGIAIYGGLIFSVGAGLFVCKKKNIVVTPMLDVVGICFLLGQSIGRWGNFFNIEAYGTETSLPWGMISNKIGDGLLKVHPTFLYESIWCFLGFLGLVLLRKYRKFDGEFFCLYIIWYSFERFFVEGLRTDSLMLFQTNVRVSQLLSFILFFVALYCLFYFYFKAKKNETKLYVQTKKWKQLCKTQKFN